MDQVVAIIAFSPGLRREGVDTSHIEITIADSLPCILVDGRIQNFLSYLMFRVPLFFFKVVPVLN